MKLNLESQSFLNCLTYRQFIFFTSKVVFFALIILMASCRQTQNDSQLSKKSVPKSANPIDFDLARIVERGSMIAIIDNSSTGYFIYKGQPMGYEYELLKSLAQDLGVTLELKITTDIDEAFRMLNAGEGDIVAHNLAITRSRAEIVAFTEPHNYIRQVLIQRKPDNWRKLPLHEIESSLIRNPIELIGKEIFVRKSSSYATRLHNLSDEIGGNILIVEDFGDIETETLIKKVADGEIDYTVADENVAKVNSHYYSNLDIKTGISFPQQIAWAVRKNAPELLGEANSWLTSMKKKTKYFVLYRKYFENPVNSKKRASSNYGSFTGKKISPFDNLFKAGAKRIGWDWRLIASQAFQESKFDQNAASGRGAVGLMQLLPETALQFGAEDFLNPQENVRAGVNYLAWLQKLWTKKIADENERIKFILASYNVGQGHVLDARKLAVKNGKDPAVWEDVEFFLLRKSEPKYYNDPVVKLGYCRGEEPVKYVREVINRYEQYKLLTDI